MTAILAKKPAHASRLKWQVYLALEDPFRAWPVARFCGVGLIVLIVLNAFLVGVTDQEVPPDLQGLVFGFGVASTVVFGIEYGCRIWVADLAYPHMRAFRARLRYMLSLMGIIDLLAVVPAVVFYLVPASAAPRDAVRIIRLVRLIKLSRYMLGLQSIARVFVKRRQEIIAAFMILALLTVASSVLMYDAEHAVQPDQFDSVLTGLYWAMTTITTTGYGDLAPITPVGRLLAFVIMVLAIGAVAIPAGIFSAGFIEEFRTQRHHHSGHGKGGAAAGSAAGASSSRADEEFYRARETFDEFAAASPAIPFVHAPAEAIAEGAEGGGEGAVALDGRGAEGPAESAAPGGEGAVGAQGSPASRNSQGGRP